MSLPENSVAQGPGAASQPGPNRVPLNAERRQALHRDSPSSSIFYARWESFWRTKWGGLCFRVIAVAVGLGLVIGIAAGVMAKTRKEERKEEARDSNRVLAGQPTLISVSRFAVVVSTPAQGLDTAWMPPGTTSGFATTTPAGATSIAVTRFSAAPGPTFGQRLPPRGRFASQRD